MLQAPSFVDVAPPGFYIRVHVQPGARSRQLMGLHGDRLKLKVNSPPQHGKANKEVIQLLAEVLEIRVSQIRISGGLKSRQKTVYVDREFDSVLAKALEQYSSS